MGNNAAPGTEPAVHAFVRSQNYQASFGAKKRAHRRVLREAVDKPLPISEVGFCEPPGALRLGGVSVHVEHVVREVIVLSSATQQGT